MKKTCYITEVKLTSDSGLGLKNGFYSRVSVVLDLGRLKQKEIAELTKAVGFDSAVQVTLEKL